MSRRTVTSKNKQKMVQDFTAALMRMAQEVANNPKLHAKDWAQELGTHEWLRRGKVLHQLEKDQKAIREVLQKRNAELSNLSAKVAQLDRGYENLPDYQEAKNEASKWARHRGDAKQDIVDCEHALHNLNSHNPKYARQYAKSTARIGLWTAFVTGLFGFNAYANRVEDYHKIANDSAVKKDAYNAKVEAAEATMEKIAQQWKDQHKTELEVAKAAANEMSQKVAATRLQLDTYEREAANEHAQARAHFKKVFEGKLSPAAQKEFSKHLEHVHSHKIAPTNPTSYTDSFSDNLFMQHTLWLLVSDYESSYTTVSQTATDLSTSSHADFSSNMLSDYGMSSSSDSSSSYSGHSSSYSSSDYDSGSSSSSSHSSWSPSPSSCSSSSCGSSCGGGGD